jgi:hypothetical protein
MHYMEIDEAVGGTHLYGHQFDSSEIILMRML